MPMANPVVCTGCTRNMAEPPGSLCAECKVKAVANRREDDRFRAKHDPVRQFELSRTWRNCSHMVRAHNPQCQVVLDNGEECPYPPTAVHHKVSPRDNWDLRLDWSNLVSLCDRHHPRQPGDLGKYRYVPTKRTVLGVVETFEHAAPVAAPTTETPSVAGPPPERVPVAPEHQHLPDGTEGFKWQWGRTYRKQGSEWLLIPVETEANRL